ncbi:unnamed protein product [Rhizophagus irregularis]|uniref:Uncharacterized protein n=1 Tax=Rhizophagus irregularis TaxID=588596 RepID=A0A916EHX3_9GLOM|nr:unnamed protein product [Rhizophagus irregularis]
MSTMACIDFFYFLWILIPLVFTWILTYEVSGDSEDDTIAYGLAISGNYTGAKVKFQPIPCIINNIGQNLTLK